MHCHGPPPLGFQDAANRLHMTCSLSLPADVTILADPSRPTVKVKWAACLQGSCLASPEFLLSAGARGTMLRYKCAVLTPRKVFITDAFMDRHLDMCKLLLTILTENNNKWAVFTSSDKVASFLNVVGAAKVAQRRRELMIFMSVEELDREDKFPEVRTRLHVRNMFECPFLCALNTQCSHCSR